jgi:hypothetical protein
MRNAFSAGVLYVCKGAHILFIEKLALPHGQRVRTPSSPVRERKREREREKEGGRERERERERERDSIYF